MEKAKIKYIDPVCGMVLENHTRYFATYKEQRFDFCSAECEKQFEHAPELFIWRKRSSSGALIYDDLAPPQRGRIRQRMVGRVFMALIFVLALVFSSSDQFALIPARVAPAGRNTAILFQLISLVLIFWLGRNIFLKSANQLRQKKLGTNSQIALALIISWLVAAGSLFYPDQTNSYQLNFLMSSFIAGLLLVNSFYPLDENQYEKRPLPERLSVALSLLVITVALGAIVFWIVQDLGASRLYLLYSALSLLAAVRPDMINLAQDAALRAGKLRLAKAGIRVKDPSLLQTICNLDTIVFNHAGVITLGQPYLSDIILLNGFNADGIIRFAAGAARAVQHAFQNALVAEARARRLNVTIPESVSVQPENGILACNEGSTILIGNEKFMLCNHVNVSELIYHGNNLAREGKIIIYVAINKRPAAVFGFSDNLTPHIEQTVEGLKRMGLRVVLSSAENEHTAAYYAKKCGIDLLWAETSGERELDNIKELKRKSHQIGLIACPGHAKNILRAAQVGFAVNEQGESGADVELADGIHQLYWTCCLARVCKSLTSQIMMTGVGYNLIIIPVTLIFIVPQLAAWSLVVAVLLPLLAQGITKINENRILHFNFDRLQT